ncbi:MAG: NAD(P)/FAD-dependent oxidoreductase [Rivularia sp. (in: Bacteria)]|nr:NAD(P)/FAD-dependent oxidoreductase [Rivularia sp. MS3]
MTDSLKSKSTVIVGGGFVGLFTALHLNHRHYQNPIILIDSQERFVFKPLLYEYLTVEMEDEQVLPRYQELLKGSKVTFIQDKATNIDLQQHRVELASGLHYDYQYLVLGVGSLQGYFGTEGAKQYAFPFRTREDAVSLGQHLQSCLQQATLVKNPTQRQALLTVAVVGAGPSGVEMAATLADLLPSWYAKLGGNIDDIRIVLVNHGEEILKGDINAHLQETALKALQSRTVPVELLLGVKVNTVSTDCLEYQSKDQKAQILTQTTIWTAGTATNPLINNLPIPAEHRDKHGLPLVTSTLQLPDFPDVFAAGDCAIVQDKSLPPVAQVAYQQGAGIADNLIALSQGKEPAPVKVNLRGTLMKLGLGNGVANLFNKLQINGKTGDLIRNATYLEMLPTPVHNFKATTEWLTDEIFHRYHQPQPQLKSRTSIARNQRRSDNAFTIKVAGIFLGLSLLTGLVWAFRTTQPPRQPQPTQEQFNK